MRARAASARAPRAPKTNPPALQGYYAFNKRERTSRRVRRTRHRALGLPTPLQHHRTDCGCTRVRVRSWPPSAGPEISNAKLSGCAYGPYQWLLHAVGALLS
jgi:hypothetical protein